MKHILKILLVISLSLMAIKADNINQKTYQKKSNEYYKQYKREFDKLPVENVKVFSGYSGWSANQLDREIQNKMWTPVEIYNLDYTLPNDQSLWKKIMQNLGGDFLLWANSPEDVSMN